MNEEEMLKYGMEKFKVVNRPLKSGNVAIGVNNTVNPCVQKLGEFADELDKAGYHAYAREVSNLRSAVDKAHNEFYDKLEAV